MFEKFKHIVGEDHLFYGIVVVLVATASFGLGRLSVEPFTAIQSQNAAIVMSKTEAQAVSAVSTTSASVEAVEESASTYVASKKGTKYHLPWCPGASQIKEENKVFFNSKGDAEKAGYEPASNCKGI